MKASPQRATDAAGDPWRINADLHSHSRYSDGTLTPSELVRRAHANGVTMLALTDHDEIAGLHEAQTLAEQLGMVFVPGVEISVSWAGRTLHIVGLNIDRHNRQLVDGLASNRAGRGQRAIDIGHSLAKSGIAGAYEGAQRHASNPELISRSHFARYLIEKGLCERFDQVFQRYLVKGKPGYVPQQWASLRDTLGWIHGAGGQAVIAHPGRYRLDDTELWALMTEFKEMGGAAIEVATGSHTRAEYQRFARIAIEHDFYSSRGSDFHDPGESRIDLGQLPLLADNTVPIWHDWPCALVGNNA